jgi:hypothetical protein
MPYAKIFWMFARTSAFADTFAVKNGLSAGALRSAELIVELARTGRAIWEVLQLAPPSVVAHLDVELSIRAETDHAAVVVAPRRLRFVTLSERHRRAVVLERAQHDQVVVEPERCAVPDEAIDAIAQQRHFEDVVAVGREHVRVQARAFIRKEGIGRRRGAAAGPVEIHTRIGRKVRMQRDAEQTALRREVDAKVQDSGRDHAVHDTLDQAGVLFEYQQIVGAQERDRDRLGESTHYRSDPERWHEHLGAGRLRAGWERGCERDQPGSCRCRSGRVET